MYVFAHCVYVLSYMLLLSLSKADSEQGLLLLSLLLSTNLGVLESKFGKMHAFHAVVAMELHRCKFPGSLLPHPDTD